ncbi:hypothetical protein [Salmonella enterica]|uniref:hypothetical protein n=1 Tax=Salmonella enterica TaxID=28901 RepID=UPI003AB06361
MMKWYLNELSLTGQFNSPEIFIAHLKNILSLKDRYSNFFKNFYCPRGLPEAKVSGESTFRDAVVATRDQNFVRKVILWLDRQGPFIDSENTDPDHQFIHEMNGKDITGTSLAAVTELAHFRNNVSVFSFGGSEPDFSYSPLIMEYYYNDMINNIEIENVWEGNVLEQIAEQYEQASFVYPDSWTGFLEYITEKFPLVKFSTDAIDILNKQQFNNIACERGIFLTSILNEYVASRNADGTYSERTNIILRDYFSGGRALFTDESTTNKDEFRSEMTFTIDGAKVVCSWHGKISFRVFRMHFNYPIKNSDKIINVVYFGPKLTKH